MATLPKRGQLVYYEQDGTPALGMLDAQTRKLPVTWRIRCVHLAGVPRPRGKSAEVVENMVVVIPHRYLGTLSWRLVDIAVASAPRERSLELYAMQRELMDAEFDYFVRVGYTALKKRQRFAEVIDPRLHEAVATKLRDTFGLELPGTG